MLANVISDVYFLFPHPVHIAPSSLSSATIEVANQLASERSERDTLSRSSMENAIRIYIYIYIYLLVMCSYSTEMASELA